MNMLGDKELDWSIYGDSYEVIVYDNGRYALYSFIAGIFDRRTKWYTSREQALLEFNN